MWKRTDVKVVVGFKGGELIWACLESNGKEFRLSRE